MAQGMCQKRRGVLGFLVKCIRDVLFCSYKEPSPFLRCCPRGSDAGKRSAPLLDELIP